MLCARFQPQVLHSRGMYTCVSISQQTYMYMYYVSLVGKYTYRPLVVYTRFANAHWDTNNSKQ